MALEKATLKNTVSGEIAMVLFNPEEYTVSRDVNYAQMAVPGLEAPILQFVHGNARTLDMELLVDTLEEHQENGRVLNTAGEDVRHLTDKLTNLMNVDASTHAPPILVFAWGEVSFTCLLSRATARFILFKPDGTPVRARITVTFTEYRNADTEAREVKRETADYTKRYTVGQGETLSGIAGRLYRNPQMWRPIALLNRIDNPRVLETGMQLLIPQLPYRDPETGEVFA